jgi:hypothetical protein
LKKDLRDDPETLRELEERGENFISLEQVSMAPAH